MTRTLRDCLTEYPRIMLEAIAEGWGIVLTDEQVPEIVDRLVVEMTDAQAVEAVLKRLSEIEREALALVAVTGQAKAHVLTRKYGELRRLGPGRLEWEQAWRQPASPIERLWFLGLLYTGYGIDEQFRGQVFWIPHEILGLLPTMKAPESVFQVELAAQPPLVRNEQDALAHDAFVIFSYLRNNEVRSKKGALSARELSRLQPRLAGARDRQRLLFLHHLCEKADLIRREEGLWKPTLEAAKWLKMDALYRRRLLYHTWLEDNQWNELWMMPGVRCEGTGWRNDPILARRGVMGHVKKCAVDTWLTTHSFVESIHEVDPDFMRPDGDYDSWYIRDIETGHYLTGYRNWERVEGALIRYLLERPLFWLGLVAIGYPGAGEQADRFMLTSEGAAILGSYEPRASPSRPIIVLPNLEVIVPYEANWYDRFLLERFTRWVGEQRRLARYVIDAASVQAALRSGATVGQMFAFLHRASGGKVPNIVLRTVRAWAQESSAAGQTDGKVRNGA